jgi:hypothetical protein
LIFTAGLLAEETQGTRPDELSGALIAYISAAIMEGA